MYSSYLKIGWRNLLRNKGLFVINVSGLAIGIATCLVILLFVLDEVSFDRYHEKADRIVRVVLQGKVNGEEIKEAVTPAPVAPTLKDELTQVADATRLRPAGNPKISYGSSHYRNSRFAYADANIFNIFSFHFLKGNPATALKEPHSIVITEKEALKYFGSEDPMNKILEFTDTHEEYKITGVIAEIPKNSHFHFDIIASMEGLSHSKENNWMSSNYYSYVLLQDDATPESLETLLPGIVKKYMGPQIEQMGMTFEKFLANGNQIGLFIQPLTDIHLHSDFAATSEMEPGSDIRTLYILSAVAVFMLLIACVNFMNLSTAGATKRNKEIGIKKVLGSQRAQLIRQFLTETFLATIFSMVLAIGIVTSVLPLFNSLAGKSLDIESLFTPVVAGSMIVLIALITFVAGGYPAFYLSSARPILALKNKNNTSGKNIGIRSGLVVFQFSVSSFLILAIIIVQQQMNFIRNKEIGYDRSRMIVIRESWLLGKSENAFINQLESDPRIASITRSAFIPAGPTDNNMTGVFRGNDHESIRRTVVFNIDEKYLNTMGMKLVAGRNFSPNPETDSLNVIINETAVKIFNLGTNPVGELLTVHAGSPHERIVKVIGIAKDFHFRSLHEAISPLIMFNNPYGGLIIRVKTNSMAELLQGIETKWKTFHAEEPFTYALLDDLYNETYQAEQKMGDIIQIFGALTIFVACMGLFGMITFIAEQRVKEIGIRKVLGANTTEIVTLLSGKMLLLVVVSFLIAFPVGFYLMNKWLEIFAYKIDIQIWMYILAGVTTLLIACVTMSIKTIQSAMANPVNSLRSE